MTIQYLPGVKRIRRIIFFLPALYLPVLVFCQMQMADSATSLRLVPLHTVRVGAALSGGRHTFRYSQTFEPWELAPQLGIEPVYFADGLFHIQAPTWTEQIINY